MECSRFDDRSANPTYNALMPDYRIRQATVSDAPVIARHRVGMFQDMGELSANEAAVVEAASRTRLVDQLVSGEDPAVTSDAVTAANLVYDK